MTIIGVIGAGAMGSGIAQIASTCGFEVRLYDVNSDMCKKALAIISISLNRFIDKGKLMPEDHAGILGRIYICESLESMRDCNLIIEAVAEDIHIKKELFIRLENIVSADCILATNTSSLSVTSIASSVIVPGRCIGIHFFNPVVLMQLVEIIPAVQTEDSTTSAALQLINSWGKSVVIAKDTPGFIVNKIARPFYGEAIRILEEGLADINEIDLAMTTQGFRMGPFALMDFIGHDINYKVTESIWKSFFYDSKYRPSFTQLRLLEAGYLGKKSDKGFYTYPTEIKENSIIAEKTSNIFLRIIAMLINEAADTVYLNICNEKDVELAVILGLNFPKGLLEWGKELGYEKIIAALDHLFKTYHEERYRVSPFLYTLASQTK